MVFAVPSTLRIDTRDAARHARVMVSCGCLETCIICIMVKALNTTVVRFLEHVHWAHLGPHCQHSSCGYYFFAHEI